jgi:DUF1680 family protein
MEGNKVDMDRSERCFGPTVTNASPLAVRAALALPELQIQNGFWQRQQQVNHTTSLQHGYAMLKHNGAIERFLRCAGLPPDETAPDAGHDSDVYKWIEAVAWEHARQPDERLAGYIQEVVPLIQAAQAEDGYLNTHYQLHMPDRRWTDLHFGHEMYTAGHLFQAAVALHRAVGDARLLHTACRFADHIDALFGPGRRSGTCGHPEVEMALVELYRETGTERYLRLAQFLVDERGRKRLSGLASYGPEYHQDHTPVRAAREAVGHAVRQLYLAAGVADLYLETGEAALLDSLTGLWSDISRSKLHINGGVGARFEGEAFGDPYELPTDQCYCETCAAIANVLWNWRMLLITGERRYADTIEQALYNAILCSPALDGTHYFYVNPLMLRESQFLRLSTNRPEGDDPAAGRPNWHGVACCPPNVMRLFASLGHYFATKDDDGLDLHQYAAMMIETDLHGAGQVGLHVETDYPWSGAVRCTVTRGGDAPWALRLRLPGWCEQRRLQINGTPVDVQPDARGYLVIRRAWQPGDCLYLDLDMPPRWMAANPRVDALRGCVALQRGPLVYCLEGCDQPAGTDLLDVSVDPGSQPRTEWQPDLLGGIVVLRAPGQVIAAAEWGDALYRPANLAAVSAAPAELTAIPYYAWGNRGLKTMRVWIPIARA